MLGIGAGWFEPEHEGYGFEFPPLGERISRLEEALQIIRPMLRDARPSFDGRFYRAKEAINSPHPIQENVMNRLRWAGRLGLLALAAFLFRGTARTQDPGKGDVTLKVVKYDGLADELLKHRGKVVVVDFWADY